MTLNGAPLQPQPPTQRPGEGEFVHEFEVTAEGHAAGQAGDYKVTATAAGACPLTSNVIKVTERNTAGLLTISGGETQVKCPAQTITLTSALSNPSLTGIYKWYKSYDRYWLYY